uniref:Preprotein translocase subunit SecA n=1 Tax=Ditylenchus dipsaci TaxID=166011 RepID=A0A915EEL5_9BILA
MVPEHLKEFAKMQVTNWTNSAIKALKMQENKDYVLKQNKKGQTIIAIVDYINTGIVEKQTVWQNGLHQFLQIKHNLRLTAESLPSCFISTRAYLKLYKQDSIFGLTGTLGSLESRNFIAKVYSFDFVFIPTFKPKLLKIWPTILSQNKDEWLKSIIESVIKETKNNRAVLVINLTIEHVNTIKDILITEIPESKIRKYSRNDWLEENESVKMPVQPGEIILATNLAGRGTDLIVSEQLENTEGLHVCVTFLPENSRIEEQAFGRTARQGKKGTAQLILNREELGNIFEIDQLKQFRDYKEKMY